ncbi:MAG: tetratricopeptide repeat protein [Chitinivibrionales bacterium]|nr:tetratricopeptide repeat protein [Chitinivibrionales bacterium]MBD3395393.1 tetratricopeptide repeat protein [Chitinivibrionales bacterium]
MPEEELEILRRQYAKDPSDRDAASRLAQAYTDLGWYNEAGDIYRALLASYKDDYSILLDYGNLCFRRKNHDEALKVFKRLTVLKPNRLEGWNNLGIVQLTMGDQDAARASFDKVLAIEPDNHGALLNMGDYYDRRGETAKAIELFEKAVEARRDFSDGWFNLGNAYASAGDHARAVDAYRRALRIQPEFPSALKNLGFAHEQMDEYDEAEECYTKALELNRTDASLYVNLASIFAKQRRYDRAKDYFLRAVKLSPREPAGWMGLRHLSLLKGDIPTYVKSTLAILHRLDAKTIAESVRKLRELEYWEGVDSIVQLADKLKVEGVELDAERLVAYARGRKNHPQCAGLYQRLASSAPQSSAVSACLAEYEFVLGNFTKALTYLEHAPKNDLPMLKLFWMSLIGLKDWDTAESSLDDYLHGHKDCFVAWFLRARIMAALDRMDEAKASLVRALENGFTDLDAVKSDAKLKKLYDDISSGF